VKAAVTARPTNKSGAYDDAREPKQAIHTSVLAPGLFRASVSGMASLPDVDVKSAEVGGDYLSAIFNRPQRTSETL